MTREEIVEGIIECNAYLFKHLGAKSLNARCMLHDLANRVISEGVDEKR